jgi:hypothetical protein
MLVIKTDKAIGYEVSDIGKDGKEVNKRSYSGRKYHSLLERINGKWCIQFGDYSKEVVNMELSDMLDSNSDLHRRDLKIITTDDDSRSIADVVSGLNGLTPR